MNKEFKMVVGVVLYAFMAITIVIVAINTTGQG